MISWLEFCLQYICLIQYISALFSNLLVMCVYAKSLQSCPTLQPYGHVACQAPLSMGFSRQEYWSGFPCPSPGDLPDSGIKPASHVSCIGRWVLYHEGYLGRLPVPSLHGNIRGKSGNSGSFSFLEFQSHCGWWLQPWNEKMLVPWKKSYDKPRKHIKKQRHYFTDKGQYS